jgi:hypothetical protein
MNSPIFWVVSSSSPAGFLLGSLFCHEGGSSALPRNVSELVPDYKALHLTRLILAYKDLREVRNHVTSPAFSGIFGVSECKQMTRTVRSEV